MKKILKSWLKLPRQCSVKIHTPDEETIMKKFLKFIFKFTLITSVIGAAVFFGGKKLLETITE